MKIAVCWISELGGRLYWLGRVTSNEVLHCSKIFWLHSSIILVWPFLERRKSIIPPLAQEILIHYGTLQHLQTLHGTLNNSSISVSQCQGFCETFVATGDWRVPIQNQETPWLDSRKKIGYATLLQIKWNIVKLWECCKHDQIPEVHRSNHSKWRKWSCFIMHLHICRGLIGHMIILQGDRATYLLKLEGLSKRKPKTIIDDSLVFQHHSFLIFKNGFGNWLWLYPTTQWG